MKYVAAIGLAISILLTLANVVFKLIAWPGGAVYMLIGFLILPLLILGLIVYQTIWPSEPDIPTEPGAGQVPGGEVEVFFQEGEDL